MRRPKDQITRARETRAWAMRSRGMSHQRIAEEIGLSPSGVSRLLARIERRELRRMSKHVERVKVVQYYTLEHISSEALEAWERSKTPRKRAGSKRSGGSGEGIAGDLVDEVLTSEVIERDGDVSYLYCAMQSLANVRSLWGLDVAPAQQDAVTSITSITRDMADKARAYEDREQAEATPAGDTGGPGGPDAGGAPEVHAGSEPV